MINKQNDTTMETTKIIAKLKKFGNAKTQDNDYGYLSGILTPKGSISNVAQRHFKKTRKFIKGNEIYLFPDNGFLSVYYLLKGLVIEATNFSSDSPSNVLSVGDNRKSAYLKMSKRSFEEISVLF